MAELSTLRQIFEGRVTKVSDRWDSYFDAYAELFARYRSEKVSILEIGIQNGGSLEAWSRYFENARSIVGVDINERVEKLEFADKRTKSICADATRANVATSLINEFGPFDIVIDDASHTSRDIIAAFLRYFPDIVPGGMFVAEDLHCSYFSEFDGGLYHPYSAVAFFKKLIDVLNSEHWGDPEKHVDVLRTILKHHDFDPSIFKFVYDIRAIEFRNSIAAIYKVKRNQGRLGVRRITGKIEDVVAGHKQYDNQAYQASKISKEQPWSPYGAKSAEEAAFVFAAENQKLMREVDRLNADRDRMADEIEKIYASSSWRYTSHFRQLGGKLRRFQSRFSRGSD